MDWIFDNFQILALVGLALASWLKSRADAKAAEREEREARRQLEEPEDVFGPAEEWSEVPPAPMVPPPLVKVNPPPGKAVTYETASETEAELKHQMDLQERLRQIRETKAVTTGGAAVTRARSVSRQTSQKSTSTAPVSLRGALHNRGQLRRAILLREILGPPLALRHESPASPSRGA
jgi:hypothetical protein